MSLLDAFLLDPAEFEVWIAIRQDGAKGSGTASDPYDGSPGHFDDIMKEIAQRFPNGGVTIHLGPGTFETNGFDEQNAANCWQAQAKTRILGSGRGATTLKLVNATTTGRQYFAIGHVLTTKVDYFEVAELTVDCNRIDNGGNGSVSCGAVRIMGDHVRIRRVKAIHWETKTTKDCVVLSAICATTDGGGAEAFDVGIEDCIVVEPGDSDGSNPVTAIHAGGLEAGVTNTEKFGRAPFIRNCFVDGGKGFFPRRLTPGNGAARWTRPARCPSRRSHRGVRVEPSRALLNERYRNPRDVDIGPRTAGKPPGQERTAATTSSADSGNCLESVSSRACRPRSAHVPSNMCRQSDAQMHRLTAGGVFAYGCWRSVHSKSPAQGIQPSRKNPDHKYAAKAGSGGFATTLYWAPAWRGLWQSPSRRDFCQNSGVGKADGRGIIRA